MRIAVTADLHWGMSRRGDRATRALAQQVEALQPDAFAIAGDVGEGAEWSRCLALFSGLPCPRLVVPGNHDLWVRYPGQGSLTAYERRLPAAAAEHGFHYLDAGPFLAGPLAIVGSINWYDYSFADPALAEAFPDVERMYREKLFPRGRHNDGQYVHLGMSDEAFTTRVVERFRAHLEALPESVASILVIQHHPPVEALFYPTALTTAEQKFWRAYTGNRRMQDRVRSDPRIRWVFCGHTHAACEAEAEGRLYVNVGGDYDFKRLVLLDTETGSLESWVFRGDKP